MQVYDYDNYRAFLKDYYSTTKARRPVFSYRVFSRLAGYQCPNFLKLVIDGQRNLTVDGIGRFIRALGLEKEEAQYFRNLVLFQQSKTVEARQAHARDLIHAKMRQRLVSTVESEFWGHWYYVVVRELAILPGFQEDPEWISRRVTPHIKPSEAREALDRLFELKLLQRTADGKIVQTEETLSTGDQGSAMILAQFHRAMIQKGAESIDRFDKAQRQVSSITCSLSPANVQKAREMIDRFRKELLELARIEEKPSRVYQINFQTFPLSEEIPE